MEITARLILRFTILLLGTSALLCAQATAPDTGKKGVVEGKILSSTGGPLPKAIVHLRMGAAPNSPPVLTKRLEPANYGTATDVSGRFVFEDVDPGRYTLSAERSGYLTQAYGARGPDRQGLQFTVATGGKVSGLTIMLLPQGMIFGKVEDEDGDLLTKCRVTVYRMGYVRGQRQWTVAGQAATSADGSFVAGGLAPGRYYVSGYDMRQNPFLDPSERSETQDPLPSHLTTYYPHTADRASATPIDIAAGAEVRGIELRLIKGRLFSLRGKLKGSQLTNQQLFLSRPDAGPVFGDGVFRPVIVQNDGSFVVPFLAPGTYTLRSTPGPQGLAYTHVIVDDKDVNGLELTYGPGIVISGALKFEGDALPATTPPVRVNLLMLSDARGAPSAAAKPDGFEVRGLVPDQYRLTVSGEPEGYYVKSVRFGGLDVTHDYIDLTNGAGGALEILLSSKAADVSGTVRNEKGEPVPNAPVTLWKPGHPANNVYDLPRAATTDASGAFHIASLPPGDYRIAAWEDLEPGLAQNPDFRERFESTALKLTLQESAHSATDLKVIGSEVIEAEIAKLP